MPWLLLLFLWQETPAGQFEVERLRQLLGLRRVYVDKLSGDNPEPIRDMLIAAIQNARLFIVTENPERADAFLRGTADNFIYTDVFQSSEGIGARTSASVGTGTSTRNRRGISGAASVDDRDALRIQERRQESRASLRLVNRDGDVIWSTTQESIGAKFKGAPADVAEKVAQRLLLDYEQARRASAAKP